MKVLAIGASRNIGYFAALSLLKEGHYVYYLLRNPSVFDDDDAMKSFVSSGQAKLTKGDALAPDDVSKVWNESIADGTPVDYVLFTAGASKGSFKLTQGYVIDPLNISTAAVGYILAAIRRTKLQPRVIIVSSYGITEDSYNRVPYLIKGVHAIIKSPLQDKLGMDRVAYHAAGWVWPGPKPGDQVLPEGWESEAGDEGWLKNLTILRPALLTDGEETGKYHAEESKPGLYTVSRKDVAHFIVNSVVKDWDQYSGKTWDIGY